MAERTKSSPGNRQMLCYLGFVRQAEPPCGIYGKDHTLYDSGSCWGILREAVASLFAVGLKSLESLRTSGWEEKLGEREHTGAQRTNWSPHALPPPTTQVACRRSWHSSPWSHTHAWPRPPRSWRRWSSRSWRSYGLAACAITRCARRSVTTCLSSKADRHPMLNFNN